MDLSKEVLLDLLLNVVGYLAAGGLSLVLYSLFLGRENTVLDSTRSDLQAGDEQHGNTGSVSGEGRRIEFIKFGEQQGKAGAAPSSDVHLKRTPVMAATSRRNRIEVIGLARKMIEAGASAEKVRAVLPISEAELALLSCERE